ncbi:sigma-54 interaction domain-containing protein [Pandoraea sputorum]|uniref:sigma-54 interaction domain-containing protein n=1 Tax=Pandoraea sputorum TaxID=93222 RepID=UPI00123FE648|nr:sigma-54 dependent transcriptional regulator [Pandoraea sputorum]VVE78570.1 Fis family transcriptional regulator [Pandoraea sputorum]
MGTHPVWPSAPRAVDSAPGGGTNDWIFADPRSQALLADIEQIAPSDASILISGETGTGKALIARHIHDRSLRRDGPFVVVSCGAFSESLVDAELFGYESGAFAGAFGAQQGWFEEANGGTIFLDEINDLALPVQNKLLRVLQAREVIRLGGRKPIPVDLRILAATSVDLEQLVAEKRFRKDLYYRLNVVGLNVLTLRERPGDIVPLARYFIDAYSRRLGYPQLGLTPDAEQRLIQAPWHGNVRELENVIHRSLLRCERSQIDAECLRLPVPAQCEVSASVPDTVAASAVAPAPIDDMAALRQVMRRLCTSQAENLHQTVEDALLYEAFRCSNYSQSETSRLLGISRNVVRARLIRLGEISPQRKAPVGIDDDNDSAIHFHRTS